MNVLSVIVPCYNEEACLPAFYQELVQVAQKLEELSLEMLFIDDGSQDRTLTKLQELAQSDQRVRYLSFSRNFGKEAAIFAGLSHCTGDYVVLMDADLQHPPHVLLQMYEA